MSTISVATSTGTNYNDGKVNTGSHVVGWSNRLVRSEVYSFTTGSLPCSKLSFTLSGWDLGDKTEGSYIPVRAIISTSPTSNVNSYGSSVGYMVEVNSPATSDPKTTNITYSLAANTTYYITFVPGTTVKVDNPWYGWYTCNSGRSFNITLTQIDYTKCSAPTTVSISNSIAIPEGTRTLSWSGAKAGTNMSIASYSIYYSTTASGTYTLLAANITSTSYVVRASATRNAKYYYKVVAKSSVSTSYDSDKSAVYAVLTTNTLPTAPQVSAPSVVKSGANVLFNVTPGTDINGQQVTLAYSDTADGAKYSFTSPLSKTSLTTATTVYFYSYDGMEYSTPTTVTVNINTAPAAGAAYTEALYTVGGSNGKSGSCQGYQDIVTLNLTGVNKSCKINAWVQVKAYDGTGSITSYDDLYSFGMQQCKVGNNTFTFNINDAMDYAFTQATPQEHTICWNFSFSLMDDIETVNFASYPTESSKYYKISKAPATINKYNQYENANISGTNGDICKKLRLVVPNDTSMTTTTVLITDVNGLQYYPAHTSGVSGNERYVNATVPDAIPADTDFTVKLTLSTTNKQRSISTSCHKTKVPTLTNFVHGRQVIKPFTDTGSFNISITWPFGDATTLSAGLTAYNCGTNAIHFFHASSPAGVNQVEKTGITSNWKKENDTLMATVSAANAYTFKAPTELGYSSYVGIANYFCQISITNLFGETYSTSWLQRQFNFNELAVNTNISNISWATSATSSQWTSLGSLKIQEGMYLKFNINTSLYTADPLSIALNVTSNGTTRLMATKSYNSSELTRATSRSAASNAIEMIYGPVGEIADSNNRNWTVTVTNNAGSATSGTKSTSVLRHVAPSATLNSCSVDSEYKFTYGYTVNSPGYDENSGGTLKAWLYDGAENVTGLLTSTSGQVATTEVDPQWEVKSICVSLTSTVNQTGGIQTTKYATTNYIIVYQVAPTVAYRKNQLGVNTSNPSSGAILDIHQSTNNHIILLQGRNTNNKDVQISIDLSSGVIELSEEQVVKHTIDLLQGLID